MIRPRRPQFALMFSKEPHAADIVREDFLNLNGLLQENEECTFRWEKKRRLFEDVPGKILALGTKKDLLTFEVSPEGLLRREPSGGPKLSTRKQEIEKERLRQQNALAHNMQGVAENILQGTPDLAAQALGPVVRLPKPRTSARRQEIRNKLKDMACFKGGEHRTELITGRGVWGPAGRVVMYRQTYKLDPKRHFKKLMKLLIPKDICLLDGVSVTGTRYCEGLPNNLIETLVMYVTGACIKAEGNPDLCIYNPMTMVKNHIWNARKKEKREAPMADEAESDQEMLDAEPVLEPAGVEIGANEEVGIPHQDEVIIEEEVEQATVNRVEQPTLDTNHNRYDNENDNQWLFPQSPQNIVEVHAAEHSYSIGMTIAQL